MSRFKPKAKRDQQPKPCIHCDKTFGTRKAWKRHHRRMHPGLPLPENPTPQAVKRDPRPPPQPITLPPLVCDKTYYGIPGSLIKSVLKFAKELPDLRYDNSQVDEVVAGTGTRLPKAVVANIIEGAIRLLPNPEDPELSAIVKARRIHIRRAAMKAERKFVSLVRKLHSDLEDEVQQQKRIKTEQKEGAKNVINYTPDIRFSTPKMICSISCNWIEYKYKFGFKEDPFVFDDNHRQLQKYAAALGGGIVVYNSGHEIDLMDIEGVHCFREAEITDWIKSQLD